MHVKMLKDATYPINKRTSQTWPKDWSGDVEDAIALQMIAAKEAEPTAAPKEKAVLTEEETAILKAAAAKALEQQAPPAADNNELTVETDLDALNVAELRAIAVGRGVKGAGKMSRDALLKALSTVAA